MFVICWRRDIAPSLPVDGSTLYFAQSERSIQGGLSFSFLSHRATALCIRAG